MPTIPQSSTLNHIPEPARQPTQQRIGTGTFDDRTAKERVTAGQREAAGHQKTSGFFGLGKGLLSQAGSLMAAMQKQEDETDLAAAKNAVNMLDKDAFTWMHEGDNPYLARKGINAVSGMTEFREQWDKAVEVSAGGLESDAQRKLFREALVARQRSHFGAMGKLALAGQKEYTDNARLVNIDAFERHAVQQAAAGGNAMEFMAGAAAEIKMRGVGNGWSPEQVEAEQVKSRTRVHAAVVQDLMVKDPQGAQAYLNSMPSTGEGDTQIDARVRARLEQLVESKVGDQAALEAADQAIAGGGSTSAQLKRLRELNRKGDITANQYRTAESRVTRMAQLRSAEASNARAAADRSAVNAIIKGGADPAAYFMANPGAKDQVSGAVYMQLLKGVPPKYDGRVHATVNAMVGGVDSLEARDLALEQVHANKQSLTPSQYAGYVEELGKFDPNKGAAANEFTGTAGDSLERSMLGQIGPKPGTKATMQDRRDYAWRHAEVLKVALEPVQAWRAANGPDKTPPPEVLQQGIDAVEKLTTTTEGWFTDTVEGYGELDADDMNKARDSLRRLGVEPHAGSIKQYLIDLDGRDDTMGVLRQMIRNDPDKRYTPGDKAAEKLLWERYLTDDSMRSALEKWRGRVK